MTMQPKIQEMIDKFHRRMDKDEKARAEVEPYVKTLNIDLGEETYHLKLEHARVTEFGEGMYEENADIYLKSTPENLEALINGTLRPMRAYMMKKIILKGKIEDLMHLKKFFS